MSTVESSTPTPITTGPTGALLSLTEKAIEKVKYFAGTMPESQGKPLRIFVQGGGCSGFQYGFTFDDKKEGDTLIETGGIQVVVDPQSANYLKDATVDFVEDMRGAGFSITNPERDRRRLRLWKELLGVIPPHLGKTSPAFRRGFSLESARPSPGQERADAEDRVEKRTPRALRERRRAIGVPRARAMTNGAGRRTMRPLAPTKISRDISRFHFPKRESGN